MQIDSTEFRYFIKTSTTLCQKASKVHKVTATEQTESIGQKASKDKEIKTHSWLLRLTIRQEKSISLYQCQG